MVSSLPVISETVYLYVPASVNFSLPNEMFPSAVFWTVFLAFLSDAGLCESGVNSKLNSPSFRFLPVSSFVAVKSTSSALAS